MIAEERIEFCKICKNKSMSLQKGIFCGLTNEKPTFETHCDSFVKDEKMAEEQRYAQLKRLEVTKGVRFVNLVIDTICIMLLYLLIGFTIELIDVFSGTNLASILEIDNPLLNRLISILLYVSYFSLFEGISGRTIGKFITNTKVINEYGEKPDGATIIKRSFCRCIPLEAFSFLGGSPLGWHDTLTGTKVIRCN